MIARRVDRVEHEVDRFAIGREARREAALVADAGREAALLEQAAQRVKDLRAGAQRVGERRHARGHDHEFLKVDVGVRVRAAVEDVHHRHGQQRSARSRGGRHEIGERRPERTVGGRGVRARDGHRHAERGVRAEPAEVRRAVELLQARVDRALIGVGARERLRDLAVDVGHGLLHALAAVAARVAVAQFERFARAGRRARRHGRAPERAALERHVDFDGRIAARVENLAGLDAMDLHATSDLRAGRTRRHDNINRAVSPVCTQHTYVRSAEWPRA